MSSKTPEQIEGGVMDAVTVLLETGRASEAQEVFTEAVRLRLIRAESIADIRQEYREDYGIDLALW